MKRYIFYQIQVHEPEFGSSTSAIVEVDGWDIKRPIVAFEDTSNHSTNYVWDGWGRLPHEKEPLMDFIESIQTDLNKICDYRAPCPWVRVTRLIKKERVVS